MKEIKAVGIKKLKDHLSFYIREVKEGSIILVTERGSVVAEIKKSSIEGKKYRENPIKRKWIQEGYLIMAKKEKKVCESTPFSLKEGIAGKLLDQDRSE